MERQKIQPIDFGKATAKAEPSNIKAYTGKIPELPKKHKVSTMFKIKSKVAEWALGVIATLPDDFVFDLIRKVVDRLEDRIKTMPNWVQVIYKLIDVILGAMDKDSDGGRAITKAELKTIIDTFWKE